MPAHHAGELEPDPTNAEVRMRRRREARERARANLLEAWARAGRIRFNDANFWDEVEAAAVAAEGRQSDAGGEKSPPTRPSVPYRS